MTHEERFEHIEQTIVQIVDMQREQADVQRAQGAGDSRKLPGS